MDYTPSPHAPGQDRPNPHQANPYQSSWTGRPADARIERALATLQLMTEKATELALAVQASALVELATQPKSAPRHRPLPATEPAALFARLFHLITRAVTIECRTAELRRTQDQRDRLADRRATGAAELSRRNCSQSSVRALVGNAIAAAPQHDGRTLRDALNRRMVDPDIAAQFATRCAADIAATICRDLAIPAAAPTPAEAPPGNRPDNASHPRSGPDDLSSREMDALLATILTHPSLDRPTPPAKPP